jgi:hypothetical protein
MGATYSIVATGAQTDEQHEAEVDVGAKRFRSLDRAQKAATKMCRQHDLKAQILDAAGWLVLRVDAKGYRAP